MYKVFHQRLRNQGGQARGDRGAAIAPSVFGNFHIGTPWDTLEPLEDPIETRRTTNYPLDPLGPFRLA